MQYLHRLRRLYAVGMGLTLLGLLLFGARASANPLFTMPVDEGANLNYQITSVGHTLTSTSEPDSTNPNVMIGEVASFTTSFLIDPGTTTNVSALITIPAGMQYLPGTLAISDNATWNAQFALAGGAASGDDLTLTLNSTGDPAGTINNTDGVARQITLTYNLLVNNVAGSQNTTPLAVGATINAGGSVFPAADVILAVVEPDLAMTFSVRLDYENTGLIATPPNNLTDAGDTFTYRAQLTNNGTSPAYDVQMTAFIPITYLEQFGTVITTGGGSAGGFNYDTGTGQWDLTWGQVNPGQTVAAHLRVRVLNQTAPGETWTATGSITYNSLPDADGTNNNVPGALGAANGGRNGADGIGGALNDYAATATSGSVSVPEPTLVKQVEHPSQTPAVTDPSILYGSPAVAYADSTDDPNTGASAYTATQVDMAIGEEFSYLLIFTLPEGTTYDFTLIDLVSPSGHSGGLQNRVLEMLSAEVIWVGANLSGSGVQAVGTTFNVEDSSPADGDGTRSQLFGGGNRDILNTPDNVTNDNDRYIMRMRVRLDDEDDGTYNGGASDDVAAPIANRAGDVSGNRLQTQWRNQANTQTTRNTVPRNDMVEPSVTVDKVTDTVGDVDAGDSVQFTLTVTNSGTGPAYNLVLTDTLPFAGITNFLTFGAVNAASSCDDIAGFTVNSATPPTVVFSFDQLMAGTNCTIIFTGTVTAGVSPNETYTNSVTLTSYDSTPEGVGHVDNRSYAGFGNTDTSTFTTSEPTLVKSYLDTSEDHTDSGETRTGANNATEVPLAVGEIIRYRLAVTLIEGVHNNLVVEDLLPAGMTALYDSAFTVTIPASVTTGIAGLTPGATTPIYNDAGVVQVAGFNLSPTSNNLSFFLGAVTTNSNTNNGTAEIVLIEFNVLVLNNNPADQNNRGDQLDNQASFSEGAGTSSGSSNTLHARVMEPVLTIDKTAAPLTGDAGDTITFTLTITNDNNANGATAFDVRVLDTLPAQYTNINLVSTSVPPATNASAGSTIDLTFASLAQNTSLTVTYSAQLTSSVSPTNVVTNTANLTWTSLPGGFGTDDGTGGNNTGSDLSDLAAAQGVAYNSGGDRGERNGSTTNQNDHNDSDPADVTINNVTSIKALLGTSEAHTSDAPNGSAGNERPVAIGEIVTFQLTTALPEGTSQDVILTDVLNTGLTFVAGGVRVFTNPVTNVTFVDLGAVPAAAPGVVIPADPDATAPAAPGTYVYNAGTQTLEINLGDINNLDSDAGAEEISVTVEALVANNANTSGGVLTNDFEVSVGGNPAVTSNSVGVIVVEPQLTITKSINTTFSIPPATTTFDGGDTVVYDVVISNPVGANVSTAFDINLLDTLDANLNLTNPITPVVLPGASTFTDNSDYTLPGQSVDALISQLQPGESVTVRITTTVLGSVSIGQNINNQANLTWTSLPGAQGTGNATPGASGAADGERNGSGGLNDYTASDAESFTVAGTVDTLKTVDGTSETHTNDLTADTLADPRLVAVGEIVTYRLVVELPEGTSPDVQIYDTLPVNLEFIPGSAVVSHSANAAVGGTGIYGVNELNPSTAIPGGAVSFGVTGPRELAFDLGQIINNDDDNSASAELLIVEFDALVVNTADNVQGATWANTFSVDLNNDGTGEDTSNDVFVRVVEPQLTITKSINTTLSNPSGVTTFDGGDTVVYDVVISNPGGANVSTAFDINLVDVIDANLNLNNPITTVGLPGTSTFTDNSDYALPGQSVNAVISQLQPGQSVTVRITVTVLSGVTIGQNINNQATVTWTSLPGAQGTGNATPGASGAVDGERDGSGGVNDHTALNAVSFTVAGTVDTLKTVDGTSETHTNDLTADTPADPRPLVVGETVTYRLVVELPEGTSPDVQIYDTLPVNLEFIPGSALVSHSANAAVGGTGIYGVNELNPTTAIPGGAVSFGVTGPRQLTFDLGQVINNDTDNSASAELLIVEFDALVVNTADNVQGATWTNTFSVDLNNDGTGEDTSNGVSVIVHEPNITISKAIIGAPPVDALEQVTYDLTVTAGSALNQSTAFDLNVTDPLYPDLLLDSVSIQTNPGYVSITADNSTYAPGGAVDVILNRLQPGDSVVLRVVATVMTSVSPGETITNTATATWTSLPGAQGTLNAAPGAPGNPDGERTGADGAGGALNDYAIVSNTPSFTLSSPVPVKSIVSTSEAHTGEATADDAADPRPVVVGEIIRYRLITVLPESTTISYTLQDSLPAGLEYIIGSARVSYLADFMPSFGGAFVGIQNEATPTFSFPASNLSFPGGGVIRFEFGSVINNDGDSDTERLIIEFNVLVTNDAANSLGISRGNDAEARLDEGLPTEVITASNEVFHIVQEPVVTITKTSAPPSLNPGEIITYELVVSAGNAANQTTAFDVLISDTLPASVTYLPGSAIHVAGVVPTSIDASGAPLLQISYATLQPGETSTIQIQARVNNTTLPGTLITNTGDVIWTSLPGSNGTAANPTGSTTPGASGAANGERNGDGGVGGIPNGYAATDSADVTTLQPNLNIQKTHAGNMTVGINSTFSVVIRNAGPGIATDVITFTDTVPAELTLVSASGTGWTCGTVGQDVTCTYPAPVGVGATLPTITVTVNPNTSLGAPFINTGVVSTAGELDPADNTDDDSVTVGNAPEPDLTITKSHIGDFTVGQNGVFSLRVQNVGTAATTGIITVTDVLPAELDFVSATGNGWSCGYNLPTRTLTCTRAAGQPVAAGAFAPTITLTVTPNTATGSPFINNAAASTPGDTNPGNDTTTDTVNVNPGVTPDLTVNKTHSGNFVVGSNGNFTLTVTNNGSAAATSNVTVVDVLPAELTFVSATGTDWTCGFDGINTVTCIYAQSGAAIPLPIGGSLPPITLRVNPNTAIGSPFVNTVTVSTPGEGNTANNTDTDSAVVTAATEPDLTVTKAHTGNLAVGQNGSFTLTVQNVGSAATTGAIQVVDTLPAELTFVSGPGTNWTCAQAPVGTVTCNWTGAALGAGNSLPAITLTVTPNTATAPASVQNVVAVTTPGDTNVANNTATDDVVIDAASAPDLSILKAHTGNFTLGQNGSFTLTVTNSGSGATTGAVQVVDTLPAELTFVSATGTDWTCVEAPTGTITCDYTGVALPLAPGASLPTIGLIVTPTTITGSPFINSATVNTPGDSNLANSTDTDSVQVDAASVFDLTIDKTQVGVFAAATDGSYTLRVQNVGATSVPAGTTVTVTDTLPTNFAFVSATGTGWTCAEAPIGTVTCTTITPAPLAVSTYLPTITLVVNPSLAGTWVNSTTLTATGDSNAANNTDTVSSLVNPAATPDLAITKSHIGDFVVGSPSNPYTYTLTVSNAGAVDYNGSIRVVDTYDSTYISYVGFTGTDWTCAEAPVGTVTCDYQGGAAVALVVGASLPNLAVQVNAVTAGIFNNVAVVTDNAGNPPDTNLPNNTAIDPTTVQQAAIFDPPFGVKVVDGAGAPALEWTMQWINPHPVGVTAYDMRVEDPIPVGTTYIAGSLSCVAFNGTGNPAPNNSQTTACFYDAVNNMIVWEGRLAADPNANGVNDPVNPAVNYLEIVYRVTLNTGVQSTTNTARAVYDANGNNTLSDELNLLAAPPALPIGITPPAGLTPFALLEWYAAQGIPVPLIPIDVQATYTVPVAPPNDQTDTEIAPVIAIADPVITKRGDPFLARPGETVTWTITASNPGGLPYNNVLVTDNVPPQFEITSVTSTLGSPVVNGQNFTLTLAALQPGQSVTMTVVTRVRGNPLPQQFMVQGQQALCSANTFTVENTACVSANGGQAVCVPAEVNCSPGVLPATGEASQARWRAVVGAAVLIVLLAGLAVLFGWWRRRQTQASVR